MKLLFQCVRMLWNDASRLIATCSDYIVNSRHISCTSSNINCPTKECPLQKKVAAKVNSSKKQQAQANDQKTCMVQTDVVKALEKAKEGSKGTMEWAKEKMKKGYEATKVRAVEGLEAEKEVIGKKCNEARSVVIEEHMRLNLISCVWIRWREV
ncbi:hypothetical protein Tco_0935135 [Tanacetum coccineum]